MTSYSEHLNIMTHKEMDGALRIMAAVEQRDLSPVCRRAIESGLQNDPLYVLLTTYLKELDEEQYAAMKEQYFGNKKVPYEDRIPPEIKKILEEVSNATS